jgi:hypothetical protein
MANLDATPHTITVSGCDDSTTVVLPLTAVEAAVVRRVAEAISDASEFGCMPTMSVTPDGEA